jgi:ATP-dependent protease Clp ATPase subunit
MNSDSVRLELPSNGTCSFCGKSRQETRAFVGSPIMDVKICDQCLGLCCRVLAEAADLREHDAEATAAEYPDESLAAILDALKKKGPPAEVKQPELQCSFCAKRRGDAPGMVMGPRVMICDGCVGAAVALVKREQRA